MCVGPIGWRSQSLVWPAGSWWSTTASSSAARRHSCWPVRGLELLAAVSAARPDGILLDINLPGQDGFAVAALIASACPAATIVLTSPDIDDMPGAALRSCGAAAFVPKIDLATTDLETLFAAGSGPEVVENGQYPPVLLGELCSPSFSKMLVTCCCTAAAGRSPGVLTTREREVLFLLIAEGRFTVSRKNSRSGRGCWTQRVPHVRQARTSSIARPAPAGPCRAQVPSGMTAARHVHGLGLSPS